MKRSIFILICSILLLSSTAMPPLIHTARAVTDDLVVTAEILYLREGPGLSYPILTTLKEGQLLTSIEKKGDWIHVTVDGEEGWVASWLTKNVSASMEEQVATQKIVISQVDRLNVRSEPSLSATVYTQLFVGAEAQFLKQENDWVQIQYGEVIGWVSASYVTVNELDETPAETVEDTEAPDTQEEPITFENDPNTFTILVNEVNISKKPDLNSKKLGVATKGQQFKVLDRKNNWVQIQYTKKKKGWVYSFYGSFTVQQEQPSDPLIPIDEKVTIIYNGTNLRESPSTSANVVQRANAGEQFTIVEKEGDWNKVAVSQGFAYVANSVVTLNNEKVVSENKEPRKKGTLKGVTIVIDPGHGGNDHGTTGARGTEEKGITLKTAELLKLKLRAAGATVELTREADVYVDLRKRVSVAHQTNADAFISIHYDATDDSSISGFTTYYYNSLQQQLAAAVNAGLASKVDLRDRGAQEGNYLVLRENRQQAVLIELGYLSNPTEERTVTTDFYREQATLGIYEGILNYFDAQLQ
ncbi:SH3 domain-containing protein [Solibacillus sp. CAU 1738]|uniref:SH3 domain-containing protein n=1 Tax=Solibacillus sp. CAU 1738 TaxID=3140363 RepID=UPI0032607CD6